MLFSLFVFQLKFHYKVKLSMRKEVASYCHLSPKSSVVDHGGAACSAALTSRVLPWVGLNDRIKGKLACPEFLATTARLSGA